MSDASLNFTGLTQSQKELLTFRGWKMGARHPDGSVWRQPSRRSVQKLLERGLVIAHETMIRPLSLPVTITEYEVPLAVHIAWCQYCKEHEVEHA